MSARLLATALAGAAALVVAASGTGAPSRYELAAAAPPAGSIVVLTSLDPDPTFFGDPVVASVTVTLDTGTIEAGSVAVNPSFDPYAVTGLPRVTTSRSGTDETIVYRYTLLCVTDGCLPGKTPLKLSFAPVIVSALADNRRVATTGLWQSAFIVSRLQKSDLSHSRPRFRSPSTMPPASYSISPGLLAGLLTALAVIVLLAAASLLGLELAGYRARARQRAARVLSPLEAAIEFTRQAANRADSTDRRKAIGLLATTLAAEGHHALAGTTEAVAWSEAAPSPSQAQTLADAVEASVAKEQA